jgi:hypothetical protein
VIKQPNERGGEEKSDEEKPGNREHQLIVFK